MTLVYDSVITLVIYKILEIEHLKLLLIVMFVEKWSPRNMKAMLSFKLLFTYN